MNNALETLTYTALFSLVVYFTAISVVSWMVPSGNYPWGYPIAVILTLAATFALHHTTRNTEKETA